MVYLWGYESRHGRAACVPGAARRVPPSSNKNRSRFAPPSRRVVTSTRFINSLCSKPTVCMRGMHCTAALGKMLRAYTHDSGWHRQACMHVILRHRPQYNARRSENLDRGHGYTQAQEAASVLGHVNHGCCTAEQDTRRGWQTSRIPLLCRKCTLWNGASRRFGRACDRLLVCHLHFLHVWQQLPKSH